MFTKHYHPVLPRLFLSCGMLLLTFVLLSNISIPAQAADREAEVDVRIEVIPSLTVASGETIAYKLRVENRGNTAMRYARVRLTYNPALITPSDATFENEADYIEEIDPANNRVTVFFSRLDDDGARFGVVFFQSAAGLPVGTVIDMWGDFDWEDNSGNFELERRTNAAPVVIGTQNLTSPYVWMSVSPAAGPTGSQFSFYSNRFLPGERVIPTILYPDGTRDQLSREFWQTVTPDGNVWIHIENMDLTPADYKMLLRGEDSDLEAVADFTVTVAN